MTMISMQQFADKIGKSRQWVHRLMREGRIKPAPIRVGKYFWVNPRARLTTVNGKRIK